MSWEQPSLAELKRAFEHQECHCTGACIVEGVRGPCPTGPEDKTFPGFLRWLIELDHKVAAAFGTPLKVARLEALNAALADAAKPSPPSSERSTLG